MKRFFKKVGYGLLGLLVLLIAISFLIPSQHRIETSVKIDAPMQIVFDQVNDLRNWERWSPWKTIDPMMEMTFSNPPAGQGAYYKWLSTNPRVGNGRLILTEVLPYKRIVTAMDFEKWDDGTAEFTFEEEKGSVKVTWGMTHEVGNNPLRKYGMLFQKGALRKMFHSGLMAIKLNCEDR